jgi:hypothetical protein
MAERTTVFANDLAPWTPDIDARRIAKPGIISLTNCIDDVDGPQSYFASEFTTYNLWDGATRAKFSELRTADNVIYGTPTGVWRINPTSGVKELILAIEVDVEFWPWTMALVGGKYYIAQYDIGLWEYDPTAETMYHIDTPADDQVRGVNVSFGRLIYLTPDAVAVSALDDGTDLTPSLTTGAHAQALSIVGGTAFKIEALPDGYVVYTSAGVLRAQFVQAAFVFSYKKLTEAVKVFSPNCSFFIPTLGSIVLDGSGFWLAKSVDAIPERWELEKSDYIKKNILNTFNKNLLGTFQLYFSQAEQKLFVSFSGNLTEGLMQTTLVYTLNSQRWGQFNQTHTGIFEVFDVVKNIFACAYVGIDGYAHKFINTNLSEDDPSSPYTNGDYLYRPTTTERAIQNFINAADVQYDICSCEFLFSDNIPTAYQAYTEFGLFYINYTPYSDVNNDSQEDPEFQDGSPIILGSFMNIDILGVVEIYAIPYVSPSIGLNATLSLGPFRYTNQVDSDQTSNIQSMSIGLTQTSSFVIQEDWQTEPDSDEDWNNESGFEDWGSGNTAPNVFTLSLRNSDDGINAPIQGDEELMVLQDMGSSLRYAPMEYSSVYHILNFSAVEIGEAFAVKFVDMSGQLTGRLMQS